VTLSEEEKRELLSVARSESFRRDMEVLCRSRVRFFFSGDEVDTDRVVRFLCAYNAFIGHVRREFRPMVDRVMKL
jgi:hypothetical protein